MSARFYPEFTDEPSKPHQCIWINEETGVRCRSYASHNSYTCHHHIIPDMPAVFSNDAFPLERAETRESIQTAIADILVRIAANQMDLKRAAILLYGLQIAATNLGKHTQTAGAQCSTQSTMGVPPANTPTIANTPEETVTFAPDESVDPANPVPPTQPVIPGEAPERANGESNGAQTKSLPRARRGDHEPLRTAPQAHTTPPQNPAAKPAVNHKNRLPRCERNRRSRSTH